MTAPHISDPARFLCEQLERAPPDLMRKMLTTSVNALMNAEADAVSGAEYGLHSEGRNNSRNGYRQRNFDTRTGTLTSRTGNCALDPSSRTSSYTAAVASRRH